MVAAHQCRGPHRGDEHLTRQIGGGPETGRQPLDPPGVDQSPDDPQKVTRVRVAGPQPGRVALAAGLVGVIAQHLQGRHQADFFPPPAAPGGVGHGPMGGAREVRHLLVGQGHETDRVAGGDPGKVARHFQQGRHRAGVVVRAGGAGHGVVVGADQPDTGGIGAGPFRHQVVAHGVRHVLRGGHRLAGHLIAAGGQFRVDVIRRRPVGRRGEQAARADFSRQPVHVAAQSLFEAVHGTHYRPRVAAAGKPHPVRGSPFNLRQRIPFRRNSAGASGTSGACGLLCGFLERKTNGLPPHPPAAAGPPRRRWRGAIVLLRFANGNAKPCATVTSRV